MQAFIGLGSMAGGFEDVILRRFPLAVATFRATQRQRGAPPITVCDWSNTIAQDEAVTSGLAACQHLTEGAAIEPRRWHATSRYTLIGERTETGTLWKLLTAPYQPTTTWQCRIRLR
ncbi:hypothetical protein CSUB01_06042 [Colletotrichum sublineola]|uniref:Uncharacterized protein n=1 Tax=Colletotrichum sublineola TaxID=1173701 RepID=A0A066WUW4_COLSU|nr:hypothetical protein CSUB01_06042 [Colletotrichum sublineola]